MKGRLKELDRIDWLTFFFSVAVCVASAYSLISDVKYGFYIWDGVAYMALVLAPLVVVLDPERSSSRSAGIFAIAVGIYNITLAASYFTQSASVPAFVYGMMYLGLGALLVFGALTYLRGTSKNVTMMFYAAVCSLAIEIIFFAYDLHNGNDLIFLIYRCFSTSLVTILANAAIIALLSTRGVKRQTLEWRLDNGVSGVKAILSTDRVSYMYRSDMERVVAWFGGSEDSYYSDKIVVSEIRAPVRRPQRFVYDLVFQRYADGRIMTFISSGTDASFAKGSMLCVDTVIPDKAEKYDSVRFYGKDGVFINVLVRDPEPDTKIPIFSRK